MRQRQSDRHMTAYAVKQIRTRLCHVHGMQEVAEITHAVWVLSSLWVAFEHCTVNDYCKLSGERKHTAPAMNHFRGLHCNGVPRVNWNQKTSKCNKGGKCTGGRKRPHSTPCYNDKRTAGTGESREGCAGQATSEVPWRCQESAVQKLLQKKKGTTLIVHNFSRT